MRTYHVKTSGSVKKKNQQARLPHRIPELQIQLNPIYKLLFLDDTSKSLVGVSNIPFYMQSPPEETRGSVRHDHNYSLYSNRKRARP